LLTILAVDPKNDHLRALDGAGERLVLLRADLLEPDSLVAAFTGCEGVFHAASPVTDDPVCKLHACTSMAINGLDRASSIIN
jgi:uncharacterized protein YbjT (DUF2867 family)